MKTLWKSLPADLKPNGFQFEIGKWFKNEGELKICESGFHCSEKIVDAMSYVNCEKLAEVEVRGKSIIEKDKQVWTEMRLKKVYDWTKKDSVKLAIYAAELVLDIFEKKYPKDERPRTAIDAAKKWLKEPTEENKVALANAAAHAAIYEVINAAAHAANAVAHAGAYVTHAANAGANAATYAVYVASHATDKIKNKCDKFILEILKNKV